MTLDPHCSGRAKFQVQGDAQGIKAAAWAANGELDEPETWAITSVVA